MSDLFTGLFIEPADVFSPGTSPPEDNPSTDGPADGEPSGTSVASDEPTCEVCGKDVPRTPTGRMPRHPRCEDHKVRGREVTTSGGGRKSKTDSSDARLATITGDLQRGLGEFVGTVAGIAPVTGAVIAMQGPPAMEALVRIAAPYPKFLDGLEAAAKAVPFVEVGKFAAAIIFAVMVDMGRLYPYGFAAESLGVAEAAAAVEWRPPSEVAQEAQERAQQSAGRTDYTIPAPPSFKLVG